MKSKLLLALIPLIFFLTALFTLPDYGISWDEPLHFYRGQAYLNYILTGKLRFDKEKGSYFQNDQLTAEYFLKKDDGHPPLNGILASLSNLIFYQKLKLLPDIESYHLFNILVSTLLVTVVVLFAWQTYGVFAALISGIVISTYPLFFAESHFNIKDPAQTAFFALTIWFFWKSLQRGWKWLLLSAVAAGFAVGTKLNILFLPFIVGPYLLVRYKSLRKVSKSYIISLIIAPFIVFAIFFATWPFLWEDPVERIPFILRWYQDIGTGRATFGYFLPGGFNLYAPIWILITTPPPVLILTLIGIVYAARKRNEHGWVPFLWLLWFAVPIARVVVPETTVYGGVRQIMEFLPAMALLAGLGASELIQNLKFKMQNYNVKSKILRQLFFNFELYFLIFIFTFSVLPLWRLHPNENVYFNFLVGGLSGAEERNIPYRGNSFGNAYWQAIQWLNENAQDYAKIALIQGTALNIPRMQLRDDLRFSNSFWSGIYRDGEYLLELTHHDIRVYPYAWEYVENLLEPVFEVKVDGVAIAKVWKNDLEHTKNHLRKKEVVLSNLSARQEQDEIILDIGKTTFLTRLVVLYSNKECKKAGAWVSTSVTGDEWVAEEEGIPANQIVVREEENLPFEVFFFPARKAGFIRLVPTDNSSCFNAAQFKVYTL